MRKEWRESGLKALLLTSCLTACMKIPAAEPGAGSSAAYRTAGEQYGALTAMYRAAGMCPGRSETMVQKQRELTGSVAQIASNDGSSALLYAVAANSLKDVQRLLAADAPRVGDDGTLLHVAARYADPPVMQALVEAGLSINALGGSMGTSSGSALTVAVGDGRAENVEWLIQHGADVNVKNPRGGSVLLYAMMACRNQALVSRLVEAGSLPDKNDRALAAQRGFDLHTKAALATRGRLGPPSGWHGPTPDELDTEPLRNDQPTKYVEAKADFDGDGKEDHAALFTADDGLSEAVFVKLSSRKANEWIVAASITHSRPYMGVSMGISVAKAAPSKQSGINFFRFESSGSVLNWDKATGQFRQTWTGD